MAFYTFRQNNSGGSFIDDDYVGYAVIIEADDMEQANERALNVGIYFGGCDTGQDCNCCGDRWLTMWDERHATEEPLVWGKPPQEIIDAHESWGYAIHVYYADGRHEVYR